MGHTYICNRIHVVFSTEGRKPLINEDIQPRLWAYMGGVARNLELTVHALNGIEDHVHLLVSLPGTNGLSKMVQSVKANSSRWMRQNGISKFTWQEGFGAFSVSESNMAVTMRYIARQKEHHKKFLSEHQLRVVMPICAEFVPSLTGLGRLFCHVPRTHVLG